MAWRTLGKVAALWRGRPFGDLADESDLLRTRAVTLTEAYLGIVEKKIQAGLELGYHQDVISELDKLTAEHPYRERLWQQLMLAEACRVKEALFFRSSTIFHWTPPSYLRGEPKASGEEFPWLEITRDRLVEVLEQHDLYGTLEACVESILEQASTAGLQEEDMEEVLMVGGSTLLPGVYPLFESGNIRHNGHIH